MSQTTEYAVLDTTDDQIEAMSVGELARLIVAVDQLRDRLTGRANLPARSRAEHLLLNAKVFYQEATGIDGFEAATADAYRRSGTVRAGQQIDAVAALRVVDELMRAVSGAEGQAYELVGDYHRDVLAGRATRDYTFGLYQGKADALSSAAAQVNAARAQLRALVR